MRQFNASERNGRSCEGLESQHGRAAGLDGPMVLLDDVVEVAAIPYHDTLPPRVFLAEHAQCEMARQIAVQVDRARPLCGIPDRLAEKCLRCVWVKIRLDSNFLMCKIESTLIYTHYPPTNPTHEALSH